MTPIAMATASIAALAMTLPLAARMLARAVVPTASATLAMASTVATAARAALLLATFQLPLQPQQP